MSFLLPDYFLMGNTRVSRALPGMSHNQFLVGHPGRICARFPTFPWRPNDLQKILFLSLSEKLAGAKSRKLRETERVSWGSGSVGRGEHWVGVVGPRLRAQASYSLCVWLLLHLCTCTCWLSIYLLENCLEDPMLIFKSNCLFFCHWVVRVLYVFLDINPLSDMWFANIFFHSLDCFFVLMMVSFAV